MTSEIGKATETIAALEGAAGAQALRARVGQLKTVLADYASTSEAEIKHQQQVQRPLRQQDRAASQAMQAAAEKARVQLQTSFDDTRSATESSITRTVTIQRSSAR